MSSFHAAYSAGALTGAGLGAALLYVHTPSRWFLIPAAVFVLITMCALRHMVGTGDISAAPHANWVRPERGVVGLAGIALFCMLVEGAMVDWSGLYLTTSGVSIAFASVGFGAFSISMILGRLGGDLIVRAIGRRNIVIWGSLIAVAGLIPAVAVPQDAAIVFGFAAVGLGLSNTVPAVFSSSARKASTAAAGIAATATAGYAGLVVGPILIGAVAGALNLRTAISVMVAAAAIGSAIAFFNREIL